MATDIAVVEPLTRLLGADAVSTRPADLDAASHDTWPLSSKRARLGQHPNRPDVVVVPDSMQAVPHILRIASEFLTPVTVRSLGSSVTGQPLPTQGGIVLDLSHVPAVSSVNERNLTVTATASYGGGQLEDELNERGYTLGHSPQSLYRSSVGGWLSTLATGQFSSLYGGIEDLVVGYRVVLATGETVELKASPRAAMGPDLRKLFIGSEGTLGVITEVTLKIFPLPEAQLVDALTFPSVGAGLEFMRAVAAAGVRPFLMRFYDADEARHALGDPAAATPVAFVGSRGLKALASAELAAMSEIAARHGARSIGREPADAWLAQRFDFSTVERYVDTEGGFAETIEVAHNWDRIEELHSAMKAALRPLADEVLAHFSHVYTQGTSMYAILLGNAGDDQAAVDRLGAIWATAMDVCLEHGAELSHHHGGGLARSPYARRALGSGHLVLRKLKSALDPDAILNPGKLGL